MPARSVCLVTLSLSEAGPGRFGGQVSVTDIYHTIPHHLPYHTLPDEYFLFKCRVSARISSLPSIYHARAMRYGQGTSGTRHVLPSISMVDSVTCLPSISMVDSVTCLLPRISIVDSVTCLRYAECSRAPGYVIRDIYGYPNDADC